MKSKTRANSTYHPYSNGGSTRLSARMAKNKVNHQNDFIAADYSTPRTTKTAFTPNIRNIGSKLRNGKYVPHLIYRPLELDNESSTESTDGLRRRDCRSQMRYSPATPLAIEGPNPSRLAVLDQITNNSMKSPRTPPCVRKQLKLEGGRLTKKTITEIKREEEEKILSKKRAFKEEDSDSDECQILLTIPPSHKRTPQTTNITTTATTTTTTTTTIPRNLVETPTQCITPPITPEKSNQEETPTPQLRNFVPGSCDIDEVLRIYGSSKK